MACAGMLSRASPPPLVTREESRRTTSQKACGRREGGAEKCTEIVFLFFFQNSGTVRGPEKNGIETHTRCHAQQRGGGVWLQAVHAAAMPRCRRDTEVIKSVPSTNS